MVCAGTAERCYVREVGRVVDGHRDVRDPHHGRHTVSKDQCHAHAVSLIRHRYPGKSNPEVCELVCNRHVMSAPANCADEWFDDAVLVLQSKDERGEQVPADAEVLCVRARQSTRVP